MAKMSPTPLMYIYSADVYMYPHSCLRCCRDDVYILR